MWCSVQCHIKVSVNVDALSTSSAELVAHRFLEEVELTDLERSAAIPLCKYFHQSTRELSEQFYNELGRHNYVTPTSYLELISSFKSVLSNKRGNVLKMKKRYEVGLEKLKFAASQVNILCLEAHVHVHVHCWLASTVGSSFINVVWATVIS